LTISLGEGTFKKDREAQIKEIKMSKYGSITDLQRIYLENGEIHISGEISESTSDYVHECMLHLYAHGSPDIKVIIRSDGGVLEPGLHIYDEIMHYPGKSKGIVRGFAHSTAAIILQACTERLAYRHSTILVHDGAFIMKVRAGDLTHARVTEMKKDMRRNINRLHALLVRHTKLDILKIRALMDRDELLCAAEALKMGLIDGLC
jgi:ATP-dependent protease ClpP protease subunit